MRDRTNNEELNLVQDKRRQAQGNKNTNQKRPPPNQTKPPIKPGSGKTWKCNYSSQHKKHAKQTDCLAYGQQRRLWSARRQGLSGKHWEG